MSSDKLQRLHNVYTSAAYQQSKDKIYHGLTKKPHLALFVNGDWIPILPGMIIGFMRNIEHIDGIAPYVFEKVNLSPGNEYINFRAWSSDRTSGRKLQFLANYTGVFRSGVDNADQAVASAAHLIKGAGDE